MGTCVYTTGDCNIWRRILSIKDESVGKLLPAQRQPQGQGRCKSSIKVTPKPCSLIHFSCPALLGTQVKLYHPDMSCYSPCVPCQPCGPTPLANSCNESCVRQCQDSTVAIQPSPVVVTLPGPILTSFPQNTVVGSSTSAAVGSILSSEGVPINSGGFGLSGLGLSSLGGRNCGRRCPPC
ncbi:feather keratin Cos1-2-like [Melopsittacus undulatus]|uniref:feather keratin Cos1-2-like n=1 Tax=Melopsittacus undulatus TaxID=13146 RepID=UPI00146A5067|nr:feather keratin Cos1-2-like [Melopsittacus undulatus]